MACNNVKFGKRNWVLLLQIHSLLLESALATESTNPPSHPKFVWGPVSPGSWGGCGWGKCKSA